MARIHSSGPFARISPPQGFTLQRIDDGLLASNLVHLGDIHSWIDSFWRSTQDFLHTGLGTCTLSGDTIASWCLTVFAAGFEREPGLATVPEYRNGRLAASTAAAYIQHGLAHDMVLHWHCWADNLPSVAVAEKVGFVREREYSVFRVSL